MKLQLPTISQTQQAIPVPSKTVVCILSGGNPETAVLRDILQEFK